MNEAPKEAFDEAEGKRQKKRNQKAIMDPAEQARLAEEKGKREAQQLAKAKALKADLHPGSDLAHAVA